MPDTRLDKSYNKTVFMAGDEGVSTWEEKLLCSLLARN